MAKRSKRRPVRVIEVNGDSASKPGPKHTKRVLKRAAKRHDIILGCEFFNLDAAKALGNRWDTVQLGPRYSSNASYVVAVRRSRGRIRRHRLRHGSAALPSEGVRDRSWLTAWIELDGRRAEPFSAGHGPPKRAWVRWPAYMAAAPRGVLGADFNKWRRAVAPLFPLRRVRMPGRPHLLGLVVPRRIKSTPARLVNVGGDHKAVSTTLYR